MKMGRKGERDFIFYEEDKAKGEFFFSILEKELKVILLRLLDQTIIV
jgi:hypothetical protein